MLLHYFKYNSKGFGIELNARDEEGEAGFMIARKDGHTEVVHLMVNSSKKFDININA